MTDEKYDVIIIGAGIIGCMTARYLSQYKLNILIIEKETDIAMGATSANSALIHSGHDPEPGSLKAQMNTRGNSLWETVAAELDIPFKRTGSYVVAIGDEEFKTVKLLYERAIENSIPEIRLLKKEELLRRIPYLNAEVRGALWTGTTGIIDPFEAALGVCENAIDNGVVLNLCTEFLDFIIENKTISGVKTNKGNFKCRWVINCAGLYSDHVMHKAGIRMDFNIRPIKGEYLIFDPSKFDSDYVLYPVPSKKGKGILVTTTIHGNVIVGPTAELVDDKENRDLTFEGMKQIEANAKRMIPTLNFRDIMAGFAGVRSKGNLPDKDFIIEIPEEIRGFVNLGGIESPGFSGAPAIAERVAELLRGAGEKLIQKKKWNPFRKTRLCFKHYSHKEREALVKKNPAYGRIVCRCEEVTEGDILEALKGSVPALTYDALKRRTWLGTGRCQGAFDYPRVIEILAREHNLNMTDITKKGKESCFLFRKTKDVDL